MIYVALLRGINVGGNNKVAMSKLKQTFESLGYSNVVTYINSGNVIFCTTIKDSLEIEQSLEAAIALDFGFAVKVIIRDFKNITTLNKKIPPSWTNDVASKTDVMFLWPEIDNINILDSINFKPELEQLLYLEGALIWNVARENVTKSGMIKIAGSPLYKHMTIRNINTVRKLAKMMAEKEA